MVQLNLSDFCKKDLNSEESFEVKECCDKSAKLFITVKVTPVDESFYDDNISEVSGLRCATDADLAISVFSDDNHLQKPEDSKQNSENIKKINELELQIESLTTEKNELKVQLGLSIEKSKQERDKMIDHMKNLDQQIEKLRQINEENIEKIENLEKSLNESENSNLALKEKLIHNENLLMKADSYREKYKIRKLNSKVHTNELLAQIQKQSEEIIQLKFNINELSGQLKQNPETDELDTRSRKNTDYICNK